MDAPRHIGTWTIGERLGKGGNATVWRASRDDESTPVALKVLHATKTRSERYRRFVTEIEFLKSLGDMPGVLPLLEFDLPARPSKAEPAWLAMPEATPIQRALEDTPLDVRVAAIATIATTLSSLRTRHGAAHRDIKPGNLYERRGKWLVGDFGLVAAPDRAEMTRGSRPLGPAHYTAYELVLDPKADPFPADVFSLGKTLWVLTTDFAWPPDGHQPRGTRGFAIADLTPHPRAEELDELVDRCTRIHPEERPTMAQVAADLEAWRHPSAPPPTLDVSKIRVAIREKMQTQLAEGDLLEQRKELAYATTRRLQELMRPLNDALRAVHPRPELDRPADKVARFYLTTLSETGRETPVYTHARVSSISSGPDFSRFTLTIGTGLELIDDGALVFRRVVLVGHERMGGNVYSWHAPSVRSAVGGIEMDRLLDGGMAELTEKLQEGLAAFVDHLPES